MSKTSRIVLLTDLHLRSDYIPGFLEKQVETLVRLVNKKPPDHVVILGDVFQRRNPRGEELLAFDSILSQLKCRDIYVLRGNHDTIKKDGSTRSTLSLFSDKAKIIETSETVHIAGVDFDFIPHYEDERDIVRFLKKSKNIVFGHFGFDGCVSNGNYAYESYVKKRHFKDKLAFLGHIHKPKVYKKVYILGTQYSNTYGEANTEKFLHELLIRNGVVEVIRKPIQFGIRHFVGTPDAIEGLNKQFGFSRYFSMLRVKLDNLDSYTENSLHEQISSKYDLAHVEVSFDDILPKYSSSYKPSNNVVSLGDDLIEKYVAGSNSVFTKEEIYEALDDITSYEN